MSDQVKEAFDVLLSQMEDAPTWEELNQGPPLTQSPGARALKGPIVGLAAAATVVVLGLIGLIGSVPESAEPAGSWLELESWPLERRSDFSQVWTGTELIVWGGLREDTTDSFDNGARYDFASNKWIALSNAPLSSRSRSLAVWTGTEVVFWDGISGDIDEPDTVVPLSTGAAYDPATDSWRVIAEGPLRPGSPSAAVWMGDSVVVAGPEEDNMASYDPTTDVWTAMPSRPAQDHGTDWISVLWTGEEVVVVSSDMERASVSVFDPASNEWRSMSPPPFESMEMAVTPGAPAHALDGSMVWLAGFAPQEVGVAGVDLESGEWTVSPPFPGPDCTEFPKMISTDVGPLLESCEVVAILTGESTWKTIPPLPRTLPKLPGPPPIWTGEGLLLLEAGIEAGAVNFPEGAEPHFWVLPFE